MACVVDQENRIIDGQVCFEYLSHFMTDGKYHLNEACYSDLIASIYGGLTVFFFQTSKLQREYVEWVINESCWSHSYLTKDVDEGFRNGFRIDIEDYDPKDDYNNLLDALRFIRVTNEYKEYIGNRKRTLKGFMKAIRDLPHSAEDHEHVDIHLPNTIHKIRKETK